MRIFLLRLCLAVAIMVVASVAAPSAYAQSPQHANEAQMPASGEATTQDARTFSGNIVKENGNVVLQDPATKVSHKLNDSAKAKQYLGKHVKITGKLDANSNTILMESIEPNS
jgi:flagellar basal body-associated protein FliL